MLKTSRTHIVLMQHNCFVYLLMFTINVYNLNPNSNAFFIKYKKKKKSTQEIKLIFVELKINNPISMEVQKYIKLIKILYVHTNFDENVFFFSLSLSLTHTINEWTKSRIVLYLLYFKRLTKCFLPFHHQHSGQYSGNTLK